MIPINAVEEFKRNPPGRVREKAPAWRVYDNRIRLLSTEIRVKVRPGCLETFEQKVQQMLKEQLYKFSGTMGRYIFKNAQDPELVMILLLWKNNEMPDEVTQRRDLEAFKADFADVLDWEHAETSYDEGLLYT
jgi:quinol monooxygenase YgiN